MYDIATYQKTVDSAFGIIRNCGWSLGDTVYQVVNHELKDDEIVHIEFRVCTNLIYYKESPQKEDKHSGLYITLKKGGSFRIEEFNSKFSKDMIQAVTLEEQRLHDSMEMLKRKIEHGTIEPK